MKAVVIAAVALVLAGCESKEEREARLVEAHCGNCHLVPAPELLTRSLWAESVLPRMGARLGLNADLFLQDIPGVDLHTALNLLPAEALVTAKEWHAIRDYYLTQAPATLSFLESPPLDTTLLLFVPERIRVQTNHIPAATFVHIDSGAIYFGYSRLYTWKKNILAREETLPKPPSDFARLKDGTRLLSLVGTINPTDEPLGSIWRQERNGAWVSWVENLRRPVDLQIADLRGNGTQQIILSEFGNLTGQLSVLEVTGTGTPHKKQISALPGARKTVITDADGDGLQDILALFAQGDEQIIFFRGDGKLGFSPAVWLRFPPVYGSSYFEFEDINADRHRDLIVTHGDNADHTVIKKPYHGIRIYLNNGRNTFIEDFFYPLPGATQTATADYDEDGDQDIAAISFFPDYSTRPNQSFVLLTQNQSSWRAATNSYSTWGRWLVMDAGDIDADHDTDLVLGALNFNGGTDRALFSNWVDEQSPVLILRNSLKTSSLP